MSVLTSRHCWLDKRNTFSYFTDTCLYYTCCTLALLSLCFWMILLEHCLQFVVHISWKRSFIKFNSCVLCSYSLPWLITLNSLLVLIKTPAVHLTSFFWIDFLLDNKKRKASAIIYESNGILLYRGTQTSLLNSEQTLVDLMTKKKAF